MERLIEKIDYGWWIVSHEQKLWLPKGELPHGNAENFGLTGQMAAQIGVWEDEPVWLVRQGKRQDMGSVRQVIDQDAGLFAAMKCIPVKLNGRCCVTTVVSDITRKFPLVSLWQSATRIKSCWLNITVTATACIPCWQALSKWGKPWNRPWRAR